MKIGKIVMVLVLFAVLSATVFAATVTHPAENIRAGIFGNIYAGNWSFMNGSVGIGTTNTSQKLMVKASAQHDGVYLQNTIGDIVGKMVAGSTDDGYIRLYNSSGTDQLTLTSRGNSYFLGGSVGIGATSPTATLQVNSSNTLGAFAVYNGSGSPLFFVNGSNGRVGIGTTTPNELLTLEASDADYQATTIADSDYSLLSLARTRAGTTIVSSGDALGELRFIGYDGTAYRQGAGIIASVDGTPGASDMPGRLEFWTTSDGASSYTERMRITSGGSVGIGTTSPTDRLQVMGNFSVRNESNANNVFLFVSNTTGNVGIGTTSPGYKLDVSGTTHTYIKVASDATNEDAAYRSDDGTTTWVAGLIGSACGAGNYAIYDNACNVVVDTSGNVGIGTTNPGFPLHVVSSVNGVVAKFNGSGTGPVAINDGAFSGIGTVENTNFSLFTNGEPRLTVLSSGSVGIGTTSPNATLHVNSSSVDGVFIVTNASGYPLLFVNGSSGGVSIGTKHTAPRGFIVNWTGSVASTEYLPSSVYALDGGLGFGYYVNAQGVAQEARVRGTNHLNLSLGTTTYPQALYIVDNTGRVGIGTTRPNNNLQVIGTGNFSGNLYAGSCAGTDKLCSDISETIASSSKLEPGDVVVIDTIANSHIKKSTESYDTKVAGIVSSSPAIVLKGDQALLGNEVFDYKDDVPLALAGRVPVKATTENGAIKPGDLLTTSSTPGHAMRCDDKLKCIGAIVGKALEPLDSGQGKITALVTLQ